MSLKYTDRETYTSIARQLNERKNARDAYISAFIGPVKAKLESLGLKFDIKGRTKSIFSIWNKMKKQKNDIDHIYDLSCYPHYYRYASRARENRLLDGVFGGYGYVSP